MGVARKRIHEFGSHPPRGLPLLPRGGLVSSARVRRPSSFLWFRAHERGAALAEQLGQRVAVLPVIAFLVVGLLLLLSVRERRAASDSTG